MSFSLTKWLNTYPGILNTIVHANSVHHSAHIFPNSHILPMRNTIGQKTFSQKIMANQSSSLTFIGTQSSIYFGPFKPNGFSYLMNLYTERIFSPIFTSSLWFYEHFSTQLIISLAFFKFTYQCDYAREDIQHIPSSEISTPITSDSHSLRVHYFCVLYTILVPFWCQFV